ncbi:MAG: hypothetical protein Q9P14_15880 [candidate division KSB1 bacterium]|nr:hypothetical protein [candidate division KSB1 bacterium]
MEKKSGKIILQTSPERPTGRPKIRLQLNAILDPVMEFLGLYADAIRELPAEEHVVVIISPRFYGTVESMFFSMRKTKSGRGIALLARRKDISLYRSGKLSERKFRNRVRIVDLAPDIQNHPELRIFANVLETALGGYEDQTFRIYGRVNYFYLPEFGALYLFDAMFTGNRQYDVLVNQQKYQQSLQEYTKHLEQYRKQIELYRLWLKKWQEARARGEQVKLEEKPQVPSPIPPKDIWVYSSVSDSALQADRVKAFQNFEDRLRQYVLDYGRTLRILKKNQWLMVSVKMRKHYEGIPKRMVMQIKKSDLELYDQRRLDRESALKRIRTMYYER